MKINKSTNSAQVVKLVRSCGRGRLNIRK